MAFGADSWDFAEITSQGPFFSEFAVVGNRKAMGLVPETLQEVEGWIFSSETDGIGTIGPKNDLFSLRQRGEGDVGDAELL